MKQVLLCALMLMPAISQAQPVINNAEDFSVGTVLVFQKCDPAGVSPGDSGANVTWDFSSLTILLDTVTEWMVLPSSTTNGYLFPTANQVEKYSDGRFIYVNKTADENLMVGYIDTTTAYPATHYPDPLLFAKRPFEYGVIISDTFTMTGSATPGTVTLHPDAYGTLLLPNGTHPSVLRVKMTISHPLFSAIAWIWFNGTNNSAVLKIEDEPNVEFLLSETAGISEIVRTPDFSFWPNPASGQIICHAGEPGVIRIIDVLGQIVLEEKIAAGQILVPTEKLTDGKYILRFKSEHSESSSLLIVENE